MPARKKDARAVRAAERVKAHNRRNRVATGQPGTPQGDHLKGFKGMKIDVDCNCGGCHPNAKANSGKTKILDLS